MLDVMFEILQVFGIVLIICLILAREVGASYATGGAEKNIRNTKMRTFGVEEVTENGNQAFIQVEILKV